MAGATWLALWLAVAAALAAASLVHSWSHGAGRRSNGKPARPARARSGPRSWPPMELAAVLSAAVVLASIAGPIPAAAAAVVVGGFLGRPAAGPARRAPGPARGALIVLAPAAAAAGVVITRAHNLTSAVVLVAMGWAYDASAYVVGTGARHRWAGPLAGMASIAAVSLFVAAVLAPPFRGTAPWVMGAMAAVLAPLGPPLVARLHRPPTGPLPGAAGRLDSLVLLAPAWAAASALLLKS